MTTILKRKLKASPLAMFGALLAMGALKKIENRNGHRRYNGGMFLGLDGVCVKSHGGMDAFGFSNAILPAEIADKNFNVRVAKEIAEVMERATHQS